MNSKIVIAIFLNTVEWGGVDVLTARLAEYLSLRRIDFFIIEPEGGRVRREVSQAKFIRPDQVHLIAERVTHLFVPSISKFRDPLFPWQDLAHAKVLAWIVHPNDPFSRFFPLSRLLLSTLGYRVVPFLRHVFSSHAKLLDLFFSKLTKEKALIVMDGATQRALKFFYPKLSSESEIVPIPSPVGNVYRGVRKTDGYLSIGYLGRMDQMKWSAIKPLIIHEIAPIAQRRKVIFHFVSEGSHLTDLKKICSKFDIELHGYGYLPNQQARELIVARTDFAIAMGTSALDMAGSGHPCVMLDPSLGLFAPRQRKFRYVHESDAYTLGEYRDFPHYFESSRSFQDLLEGDDLEAVALRERSYVQRAHDPSKCFDALMNRLLNSTLEVTAISTDVQALNRSFEAVKSNPLAHFLSMS